MDKFFVRLSAILVNLDIFIATILAWNGRLLGNIDYLINPNFFYGMLLIILSHTQGRYHCVWMRALCYNCTAVSLLNYLDGEFYIFDTVEEYLYMTSILSGITILATIYLAIRHFRKVRKVLSKYGK